MEIPSWFTFMTWGRAHGNRPSPTSTSPPGTGSPSQRSWTVLQPFSFLPSLLLKWYSVWSFVHPDLIAKKKQRKRISISKAPVFLSPPLCFRQASGWALNHLYFPNLSESFARVSEAGVRLNNHDRWLGLREEITIFLLKFAAAPQQGDAARPAWDSQAENELSTLLYFSSRSALCFKITYHPALDVNMEGRSFNSSLLKTRQSLKEKANSSIPIPWSRPAGHPLSQSRDCAYSWTYWPSSSLVLREQGRRRRVLQSLLCPDT